MPIKVKVATGRGFEVLRVIRDNEGASYRELCAQLAINSNYALSRHVKNLERKGLITREPNKHRSIRILPAGLAALE